MRVLVEWENGASGDTAFGCAITNLPSDAAVPRPRTGVEKGAPAAAAAATTLFLAGAPVVAWRVRAGAFIEGMTRGYAHMPVTRVINGTAVSYVSMTAYAVRCDTMVQGKQRADTICTCDTHQRVINPHTSSVPYEHDSGRLWAIIRLGGTSLTTTL